MNKELREKVYEKESGHCGYCGTKITYKEMQVDHIVSQREFAYTIEKKKRVPSLLLHLTINDINHIDNLMPSCRVCNKWKNTYSIDEFRKEVSLQIERLNKRSANYRMAKKFGLINEINKPVIFHFEQPHY